MSKIGLYELEKGRIVNETEAFPFKHNYFTQR
jgi:hypothetical protein